MTPADDILVRHAVAAAGRHRSLEPAVRALAADVPPARRAAWDRMAAALSSGRDADVALAAAADPACWVPLVAHASPVAAVEGLAAVAARPTSLSGGWWRVLAYPLAVGGMALVVVFAFGSLVLPVFKGFFADFGLQLPLGTRLVMGLMEAIVGSWGPLALGAAALVAARMILLRRSPRGPAVTATFTAALADLVAGGIAADDALALAARSVGVRHCSRTAPRRPLTEAAASALELPAPAGHGVLRALAANHAARGAASQETLEWFVGPLAVGVAGCIVGLVVIALFMPLIHLVTALT